MDRARPASDLLRARLKSLPSVLVFPLAALFNSFSMTGLLLLYGLAGRVETAADIGLVQAATLALFFAFSANARNLVLGDDSGRAGYDLLRLRLLLMLPLALAVWFLSARIGNATPLLAVVLILRRLSEWVSEIGLAVHERQAEPRFARQFLLAELIGLGLACLPLLMPAPLFACLIPWALAPLVPVRRVLHRPAQPGALQLRLLLPHFGSTAAIGMSTYIFRISLALLAGKALAGELFTAFAIGGLLPTLFGQALAPTLSLRLRGRAVPRSVLLFPLALLLVGGGLWLLIQYQPQLFASSRHTPLFWNASALSLAGGGLMAVALVLRTRLIQSMESGQVYGPDLLANVLIATCVPFVYGLFGKQALSGLFLLSASLNLAFFIGAGRGVAGRSRALSAVLAAIAALLVAPVFVQICCGLFQDASLIFDTRADLQRLPLPLSLVAVFAGIAALGNYSAAVRSLSTLFFTAILFVLTSLLLVSGNQQMEMAKLILLAQFLLPLFGMVLGEMAGSTSADAIFERSASLVLLAVLPLQLLASWMHGHWLAQPQVFVFSIYQHLQYLPSIVAAVASMAALALWDAGPAWRRMVCVLWPIVMLHLAASRATDAVLAASCGLALFAAWNIARNNGRRTVLAVAVISVALAAGYFALSQDKKSAADAEQLSVLAQANPGPRLPYWRQYLESSTGSGQTFLLGHAERPDRTALPSAYNYWLDALYNFGALSILPMILLLAGSARMAWQKRRALLKQPLLLGNLLACAYLLLWENMLAVGMRQPYPGLITLFILGLLIARLRRSEAG